MGFTLPTAMLGISGQGLSPPWTVHAMTDVTFADQEELAALGARVRERLATDPSVYKVPVERAEIFAIRDFLSAEECDHLIGMIDAVAQPSQVFDVAPSSQYRTSYSGDIDPSDSFVKMVERRLSDLLGIDPAWGECVQGQRYREGQQFMAHCDWFDTDAPYWNIERERGGQRSWTAMAYLCDVEEGGETDFSLLGVSIPPQRGALIVWNNAEPGGTPNDWTLHAAKPVSKGVKYVITKWFRTRTWT